MGDGKRSSKIHPISPSKRSSIAELFSPVSSERVYEEASKRKQWMENNEGDKGGLDNNDTDRSNYWYESTKEDVDENKNEIQENRDAITENRIYLEKIDVKVTWLVRIIAAVVTAGAVRYSVAIFGM